MPALIVRRLRQAPRRPATPRRCHRPRRTTSPRSRAARPPRTSSMSIPAVAEDPQRYRQLHASLPYQVRSRWARASPGRRRAARRMRRHAACGRPRSSSTASRRAKAGGSGSCSPSTMRAWSSSSQANSPSWSEAPVSPTDRGEPLDQPVARVEFEDALGCGVELAMLLQQALEMHVHVALVGDEADRAVGQPLRAAHVLDRVAERQLEDRDQAGELGRRLGLRLLRLALRPRRILSRSAPPRVADLNGFSL